MRSPFDILEAYERRSLAHAVQLPERQFAQDLWRGVGYRVGQRRLVSDFREVVEIVPMPPVTPVPCAQPWLLGVGNLRGNLFPVVDLKYFLEGTRTVQQEGQRVLIMRQAGGDVALAIDELFGQRSFRTGPADRGRHAGRRALRPLRRSRLPRRRPRLGRVLALAAVAHP
jgi:twitching motility protein PilI